MKQNLIRKLVTTVLAIALVLTNVTGVFAENTEDNTDNPVAIETIRDTETEEETVLDTEEETAPSQETPPNDNTVPAADPEEDETQEGDKEKQNSSEEAPDTNLENQKEEEKEADDLPDQNEQEDRFVFPEADASQLDPATDFSSMRLIMAGELKDPEHILSEYDGTYLLQYDTIQETRNAYAYYVSNADFVEVDTILLAADEAGTASDEMASSVMEEGNTPFDALETITSGEDHFGEADGPVIALIDTGVKDIDVYDLVSVIGEDPADDNGHGSAMAGFIYAENTDASIISIKALDAEGRGDVSAVYAAIKYAIESGVDIINLSMSAAKKAEHAALEAIIGEAVQKGILVVASAGNNGKDAKFYIPGCIDGVITAASCDETGKVLDTSNRGDTVDYYVRSESTSEAAAILSGVLSRDGGIRVDHVKVFEDGESAVQEEEPGDEGDGKLSASATQYTLTWNPNGGSMPSSVASGFTKSGSNWTSKSTNAATSKVGTLPTNPTRSGYAFNGWYTAASGGTKISTSTTVTKNTTYYAQWTPYTMTLRYHLNGGSINGIYKHSSGWYQEDGSGRILVSHDSGSTWELLETVINTETQYSNLTDLSVYAVNRYGYYAAGTSAYNTSSNGTGVDVSQQNTATDTTNAVTTQRLNGGTQITGNVTKNLYINWKAATFTFTLNGDGGKTSDTTYGSSGLGSVTLQKTGGGTSFTYTDDITVGNTPLGIGFSLTTKAPRFKRSGYFFRGWSTVQDNINENDMTEVPSNMDKQLRCGYAVSNAWIRSYVLEPVYNRYTASYNITLYAQWIKAQPGSGTVGGITLKTSGINTLSGNYSGINFYIPYGMQNSSMTLSNSSYSIDSSLVSDLNSVVYNNASVAYGQTKSFPDLTIKYTDRAFDMYGTKYDVAITLRNIRVYNNDNSQNTVTKFVVLRSHKSGTYKNSALLSAYAYSGSSQLTGVGISYRVYVSIQKNGANVTSLYGTSTPIQSQITFRDIDVMDHTVSYPVMYRYQARFTNSSGSAYYPYAEHITLDPNDVIKSTGNTRDVYLNPSHYMRAISSSEGVTFIGQTLTSDYDNQQAEQYGDVDDTKQGATSISFVSNYSATQYGWGGSNASTGLFDASDPVTVESWVGNTSGEYAASNKHGTITLDGDGPILYPYNSKGAQYTATADSGYVINEMKYRRTSSSSWTTITEAAGKTGYTHTFGTLTTDYQIYVNYKTLPSGSVTVNKYISGTSTGLANATLTAYQRTGANSWSSTAFASRTTNSGGQATFTFTYDDSTTYGNYYRIKETVAPTGYSVSGTYLYVGINSSGTVSVYTSSACTTTSTAAAYKTIYDSPYSATVSFTKHIAGTSTALPGATFTVYQSTNGSTSSPGSWSSFTTMTDSNGSYSATLTYSEANGGWFRIYETGAPAGFDSSGNYIYVRVTGSGTYTAYTGPGTGYSTVTLGTGTSRMDNSYKTGSVTIYKYMTGTTTPLAGAVFRMQRYVNGSWANYGATQTTTSTGTLTFALTYSQTASECRYRIYEVSAPDGYYRSTEYKYFLINPNGTVTKYNTDSSFSTASSAAGSTTFYNAPVPEELPSVDITINKTIYKADLHDEHGAPNFAFEITGVTADGQNKTYHTVIDFTGVAEGLSGTETRSGTVTVPAGTYTVRELNTDRYMLTGITSSGMTVTKANDGSPITIKSKAGTEEIVQPVTGYASGTLETTNATVTFTNRKTRWDDYSHTSSVVNHF